MNWNAPRELGVGRVLVLVGIVLFVGTITASAVLAPSVGEAGGDETPRTLVGSQGGGPGWHKYGSVYLLDGEQVAWREASADSYFDVTKTQNGTVLAGFMHNGYTNCGPYEPPCARTGFRVIDPTPNPRIVSEYSFPVRTQKNSEVHDIEPLPSGGYLLTDMEYERIFTVQNGTVTWQWNASSFYDAPPDPTKTDWLHINDVDVISEGRYLVSVRNANQLVVVERGEGVVSVVNRDTTDSNDGNCKRRGQLEDYDGDGEVRCGNPSVINHQHNPQWLSENAILVADSDNDRVVELHKNGSEWTPAWTLRRAGELEFKWPRDADRLPNGNTLITDTLNRRIVEVNESGTVVWSYRTDRIPYEADRLPVGEPTGGSTYDERGQVEQREDPSVLSPLVVVSRAIFPWLPYWYRGPQVLVTLVSLAFVGIGAAVAYRNRDRATGLASIRNRR